LQSLSDYKYEVTKHKNMTKPVKWGLLGVIMLIIIGMIVYPRIKQYLSSGDDAPQILNVCIFTAGCAYKY